MAFENWRNMIARVVRPSLAATSVLSMLYVAPALAQELQSGDASKSTIEVYGFVKFDAMSDVNGRMAPNWTSAFRPSQIATPEGQFGSNGETSFSVRQSRLGVKAGGEAAGKPWEAVIEFDLFGVGDNAGKTTFRMRHAYGKWGPLTIGHTFSVFMDGDSSPKVIDPWGPSGLVSVRTPQIRITFVDNGSVQAMIAAEHVSENIDPGSIRLIDEDLANSIRGKTTWPDLTAAVRYGGERGHIRLSGLLREIAYETPSQPNFKPTGKELGWGMNLSGSFKLADAATFRGAVVYGHGIANYISDGGMDIAPSALPVAAPLLFPTPPIQQYLVLQAKAVPLLGISAYVDLNWSKTLSSAIGYSQTSVDNTNFQTGGAFHKGQYASTNLLWSPDRRILTGGEVLWGKRTNANGITGDDVRLQFSFKLSFSSKDLRF